jgi:hypothetical protein
MFDLVDLSDFCLARGTPFSLVCFAEKSFKLFKIVHNLFILFVRFGRFLPDRALLFLVCFAEKSFKIVQNLFILFVRFGRFVGFLPREGHSIILISDAKLRINEQNAKEKAFSFHFRVKVPSREAKNYKEKSSPPNDEPELL